MKICVNIEIDNIEQWDINWKEEISKNEELFKIKSDIIKAISDEFWIQTHEIKITDITIE